jgi:hypothetical protein
MLALCHAFDGGVFVPRDALRMGCRYFQIAMISIDELHAVPSPRWARCIAIRGSEKLISTRLPPRH